MHTWVIIFVHDYYSAIGKNQFHFDEVVNAESVKAAQKPESS